MKKLFFAAVLAIVATSGAALNLSAATFYTLGSNDAITCETGVASCADEIDGRVVYEHPASSGDQGEPVEEDVYANLEFIP